MKGDYTDPQRVRTERYNREGQIEEGLDKKKFREMIDQLNEDVVRDLIAYYFQKSGNELETMNFIPFSEIILESSQDNNEEKIANRSDADGSYSTSNGIVLNIDKITDTSTLIWTIIHEELHAVTDTDWSIESVGNKIEASNRVGFEINKVDDLKADPISEIHESYSKSNEGFTELITAKLFAEYIDQTGSREEFGKLEIGNKEALSRVGEYGDFRHSMQRFIEIVASLADVEYDVVEKAMIRGYFRNSSLMPVEVFERLEQKQEGLGWEMRHALEAGDLYELMANMLDSNILTIEEQDRLRKHFKENTLAKIADMKKFKAVSDA